MTYSIKNWDSFQHYKERHPPWIKLYHTLLDDEEFGELDHFSQLLYFKLLMAASRKDNRIPADASWMATELSLPKRRVQTSVKVLLASGFLAITVASKSASTAASTSASENASPSRGRAQSREVETETEEETEKNQDQEPNPTPPVASYLPPELRPNKNGWGDGNENGLDQIGETAADLIAKLKGAT